MKQHKTNQSWEETYCKIIIQQEFIFKGIKTKKTSWQQGHTPLTTQLPSPALEEDTPLATANITSKVHETPDSPSTRSKISFIKTAVVPSSFEHSNKSTPKQFYFGQG